MSQLVDQIWALSPYAGVDEWTNSAGTLTTGASAYTYGTGGDCGFIKFKNNHTARLDYFLFHVDSTITNGDLRIELRESNYASGADKPSSILLAASTLTISGSPAAVWKKVSFIEQPLIERNKIYFLIFGNAGGNIRICQRVSGKNFGNIQPFGYGTSANGFTTAPSNTDGVGNCPFVLRFTDGYRTGGGPFTSVVGSGGFYSGSGTSYQGLYVGGLTEPRKISRIRVQSTGGTRIGTFSIFKNSTLPIGTPDFTLTIPNDHGLLEVIHLGGSYKFEVGNFYRVVVKVYSGAAGVHLQHYDIADYASFPTDLSAVMPGQGAWGCTKEDGGVWVDDFTRFPFLSLCNRHLGAAA